MIVAHTCDADDEMRGLIAELHPFGVLEDDDARLFNGILDGVLPVPLYFNSTFTHNILNP